MIQKNNNFDISFDKDNNINFEDNEKGSIQFKEIRLLVRQEFMKFLIPSILNKFNCDFYTLTRTDYIVITKWEKTFPDFLIERFNLFPKICIVNENDKPNYKILLFDTDIN